MGDVAVKRCFDNDYVTPVTACKIVPSGFSPRKKRKCFYSSYKKRMMLS